MIDRINKYVVYEYSRSLNQPQFVPTASRDFVCCQFLLYKKCSLGIGSTSDSRPIFFVHGSFSNTRHTLFPSHPEYCKWVKTSIKAGLKETLPGYGQLFIIHQSTVKSAHWLNLSSTCHSALLREPEQQSPISMHPFGHRKNRKKFDHRDCTKDWVPQKQRAKFSLVFGHGVYGINRTHRTCTSNFLDLVATTGLDMFEKLTTGHKNGNWM